MEGSQSLTGKTGVWQRIFDLFFGYDYFIAHRSVDGKPYAATLYDALTTGGKRARLLSRHKTLRRRW